MRLFDSKAVQEEESKECGKQRHNYKNIQALKESELPKTPHESEHARASCSSGFKVRRCKGHLCKSSICGPTRHPPTTFFFFKKQGFIFMLSALCIFNAISSTSLPPPTLSGKAQRWHSVTVCHPAPAGLTCQTRCGQAPEQRRGPGAHFSPEE